MPGKFQTYSSLIYFRQFKFDDKIYYIILIQSHIISSKITKLERYLISLELSFQFHCHFRSVCIHVCMLLTWAIHIVTHERSKWNIIQKLIINQYKWHSTCNFSHISDFWYTNRVNKIKVTRHDKIVVFFLIFSMRLCHYSFQKYTAHELRYAYVRRILWFLTCLYSLLINYIWHIFNISE